MHTLTNKLIILIPIFTLALFSAVLVNPVFADHCGDLNFCESCVASHCGWGGPSDNIQCRETGTNTYSCPSNTYSLWYTLTGQCGTSSGNFCAANAGSAPAPCNTFNGNCSACLQQSACAYSNGYQCVSVDPNAGDVCPAGVTTWNWDSCSVNECSTAPATNPVPSPIPSAAPGARGYRADIQQCRADGSGWDTISSNQCTLACGIPPASPAPGQPTPSAPVTPVVPIVPITPVVSPAPSAPTAPNVNTPWIQTTGGDVHSNTKIDVP